MKFAAIADWAEEGEFPVRFMCTELEVSPSGYYRWLAAQAAPLGPRASEDEELLRLIRTLHRYLSGNPGVRRIHAGLVAMGRRVSRKRVHRLMRQAGLQGRHPKAWRKTTLPGAAPAPAPDLIGRVFTAPAARLAWCGDITYIKTWTGWAFLATVIDLHTRALVGWEIADHMRTDLVIDALRMALEAKNPAAGVIFHSDRGSQYTSAEFVDFCTDHNVRRSVGRTGSCFDNAVSESFNATYKKELIHTRPWPDVASVIRESRNWFIYYNLFRRHSSINYLTPYEKELGWTKISELPQNNPAA